MPDDGSIGANQEPREELTDSMVGDLAAISTASEVANDFHSVALEARQLKAVVEEYLAKGGKFGHGVVTLSLKSG
jgi:hypothetical protein